MYIWINYIFSENWINERINNLIKLWLNELLNEINVTKKNGYIFETRSTPRAQTSDAPNLRNVKQSTHAWNSPSKTVVECSLFHARPILKISWKSVNVAKKHEFDPKKETNISVSKGLNVTYPKCFGLLFVSSPTNPENFMKIRPSFLTDRDENITFAGGNKLYVYIPLCSTPWYQKDRI